ncbi:MAG: prephenate dehydrogenase [Eubacteriaceae bacterium]|jgi:prephenate dehydrogenase|nr:prephenate dehydrogenase [Eubacteriaceae bacterium]
MNLCDQHVAVIGLGLMGGAFALGLRQLEPASIMATDCNKEVLEKALEEKIIDYGAQTPEEIARMLFQSHLIILCLYPSDAIDFVKTYGRYFQENAILTDIVGVKEPIIRDIKEALPPTVDFIPGHPMAGSEKEGFLGATEDIFVGRNYVLTPLPENKKENLNFIKTLIKRLGFVNIVESTPEEHDRKIAFTSQLCHVIAAALVDADEDLKITDFEGGSFGDLTRIAMINAPMWTELFLMNKKALLAEIDKFEESLQAIKGHIAQDNAEALIETLKDVRDKRVVMEIQRMNKTRTPFPTK